MAQNQNRCISSQCADVSTFLREETLTGTQTLPDEQGAIMTAPTGQLSDLGVVLVRISVPSPTHTTHRIQGDASPEPRQKRLWLIHPYQTN